MSLENILSDVKVSDKRFKLNPDFRTIRYIENDEYADTAYGNVEYNFTECECFPNGQSPRFIIFSAPGSVERTALAKHICYSKNGMYWNLPEIKVAEYSLQGSIQHAVGAEYVSDFYKSLKDDDVLLVIDAFEEAEDVSGRTGIKFFLRDLTTITKGCNHVCAILIAETESAAFIKNCLANSGVSFKHYEIDFSQDKM